MYSFDIHQPYSLTHQLWEVLHQHGGLLFQKEMLVHYTEKRHMIMEKVCQVGTNAL